MAAGLMATGVVPPGSASRLHANRRQHRLRESVQDELLQAGHGMHGSICAPNILSESSLFRAGDDVPTGHDLRSLHGFQNNVHETLYDVRTAMSQGGLHHLPPRLSIQHRLTMHDEFWLLAMCGRRLCHMSY
ncbi:MAG: hypothetical protein VB875_08005 [Pirellulales bacterium]